MMSAARLSPIPGRACRSAALAELMSRSSAAGVLAAGAGAAAAGGGALAGAAGCAVCAKQAPPRLTAARNDRASKDVRLKLMAYPNAFGLSLAQLPTPE